MSDSPKPTGKKRKQRKVSLAAGRRPEQGPPPVAVPGSRLRPRPARAVRQPRAVPAGVPAPGARGGRGRTQPAARAGQVPGHRRLEPGRVLHGPGRRPQAADRGRGRRAVRRRHDPGEQLAAIRKARQRAHDRAPTACLDEKLLPGAERGRHPHPGLRRARPSGSSRPSSSYFDEVVFPVLTPLALTRAARSRTSRTSASTWRCWCADADGETPLRPRQGARHPAAPGPDQALLGRRPQGRHGPHDHYFVWLEQVIAANLDALFPGMDVVEAHPFRVTRNADIDIQELEAADLLETHRGERAAAPASAPSCGWDRTRHARPRSASILFENLEVDRKDVYILRRPARPVGAHAARPRSRPPRPQGPALPAGRSRRPSTDSRAGRRSFAAIRARGHPPAPPVRLLRPGRRLPARGRPRPGRAGHQDDPLPRRPELAGGRGAARGQRERQAGGGAGRAEGALRRGDQHRVGARAGSRGRARGLRPARPEDPLQDGPGGAPRGRAIRRYVHLATGNYNPVTAAALHRHRAVHLRRGDRRRRHRPVQLPHRLLGQDRLPQAAGRADQPARRASRR